MNFADNPPGTNGTSGSLCYVAPSGSLGYKVGSADAGKLIYKADYKPRGLEHKITLTWPAPCRDLDILAYWEMFPDQTVGWGQSGTNYTTAGYCLSWDGDVTTEGGTEIVRCECIPWQLANRTLYIHFNYYGVPTPESQPALPIAVDSSTIEGWAGPYSVVPANRHRSRAEKSDPGIAITFESDGSLESVRIL